MHRSLTAAPAQTSDWPLSGQGERILLPQPLLASLANHPLSRAFHPLAFGYYPRASGHRMTRRQPADDIVIYCVDGRASVRLGEHRDNVQAGDLLYLPAGQPHSYEADPQQPWSLFWMHLGGEDAVLQLRQLFGPRSLLHPGLQERLISDFRALLDCTRGSHQLSAYLHAANLCRALLSYAALLLSQPREPRSGLDIEALHLHLQARINERLTLEEMAALAGQSSRYQFIRHYRAHTGQTPVKAFLHMKVARACYLLETSRQPVTEIARQLGFDDPYYFSRLFRKATGASPAQYRKQGMTRPLQGGWEETVAGRVLADHAIQ